MAIGKDSNDEIVVKWKVKITLLKCFQNIRFYTFQRDMYNHL